MNNHEHLDTASEQQTEEKETARTPVRQMVFESELGEQQMRRLFYRRSGQLGPGTY